MQIMKKLTFALLLPLLIVVIAGCSSGSSSTQEEQNITGLFRGPFKSSNDQDEGVMILNLAHDEESDKVQGTIQFEFNIDDPTCLKNGTIEGDVNGASVRLTSDIGGGVLTMQLTIDNSSLRGTYVTSGDPCSNFSGSGSIVLNRQ